MTVPPPLHLSLTTLYTLDLTRWSPESRLGHDAMSWREGERSVVAVTPVQSDACLLRQVAAHGGVEPESLRARYLRGSHCRAMTRDGDVLSYCWVSSGRERIGESECDLELPPGMAYIWDCATLPPYRGRGLYSALMHHIAAELQHDGCHRVWVAASWSNHASRRGIVKVGFEHVATIVHLCVGPWRATRLVSTATTSPEIEQLTCQLTRIPPEQAGGADTPLKESRATLSGKERRHPRDSVHR